MFTLGLNPFCGELYA